MPRKEKATYTPQYFHGVELPLPYREKQERPLHSVLSHIFSLVISENSSVGLRMKLECEKGKDHYWCFVKRSFAKMEVWSVRNNIVQKGQDFFMRQDTGNGGIITCLPESPKRRY